jgi:hypothetical protein
LRFLVQAPKVCVIKFLNEFVDFLDLEEVRVVAKLVSQDKLDVFSLFLDDSFLECLLFEKFVCESQVTQLDGGLEPDHETMALLGPSGHKFFMCFSIFQTVVVVKNAFLHKFSIIAGKCLIGKALHVELKVVLCQINIPGIGRNYNCHYRQVLFVQFKPSLIGLNQFLIHFES